tara:strand:+ start:11640 stop:15422 length:3783 start_codon:yes stop_codon:yes gene_type:complete
MLSFSYVITGLLVVMFPVVESSDEVQRPHDAAHAGHEQSEGGASMYRFPDISNEEIVFVYANDLWRVPAEGGVALPLASPAGVETIPRFSPDGSEVAFVGNYDGNRDLYVVPTQGGMPRRITHHPTGERLSDWTSEGDLLFSARNMGGVPRAERIYQVSGEGGLPSPLPMPYGANAAIDQTGTWVAYTPNQRDGRTWKRYRGGMASDVWLVNLETGESRQVTDWEGTDTMPMWHGSDLYYLSDAGDEHRLNLWRYDVEDGSRDQVTSFKDYDIKWPAIGPDDQDDARFVFQNGADIYVHDTGDQSSRRVEIDVPGATASLRSSMVDASDFMENLSVSPSGKRVAVEARGDIWTLPAKNGSPRNLTRSSGAAERSPSWSPDGKWIAYFSDEPGEYELFVRRGDGRGEPRRLTDDMGPFKNDIYWSPDSSYLIYADKTGDAHRVDIESGEGTTFARNDMGIFPEPVFSSDGRWITWSMATGDSMMGRIHIHDFNSNETHVVTKGMFNDGSPTFDRDGDWLYFTSDRRFAPSYSSLDGTWIYDDSGVLVAVPLREDVESPWLAESDEEEWSDDEDEEEGDEDADGTDGDDSDEEGESNDESDEDSDEESDDDSSEEGADSVDPADPVSGTWECVALIKEMGELPAMFTLELSDDGTVSGTLETDMFDLDLSGTFDEESMSLELNGTMKEGGSLSFMLTIDGDSLSGSGWSDDDDSSAEITGTRMAMDSEDDDEDSDDSDSDEVETFEIDFEGFEARGMKLPVSPGGFRNLRVNDKNHLMYVRQGDGIKVFDMSDREAEEKSAGTGGSFQLTADGKMMLVPSGSGGKIRKAGTGDGGDRIVSEPMLVSIDPRSEWRQLVVDAWRIQRDHFYDPGMHGVDWNGVLEDYLPLVDQAATREDVSHIIGEMISELNVGHAYYYGGDVEGQPSMNVGMLGVEWEAAPAEGERPDGYRIARVLGGGDWDVDARGPLQEPGVKLGEGDVVLAVNGIPMQLDRDPWAPFVGTAGSTVVLTVVDDESDEGTRDVVVDTIRRENSLRYRDWIENRRALVEELSDGKVGYIYVPNTGRDGQSDLVRQYHGQSHMPALIIDERWNGGGQIPDRFIELLNRPVTNYWATRDSKDWRWPMGVHAGPKAMLINGLAGSGGDMFPWLFRENDLGPLIGTRTWGGLVGISGNPGLIDGGYTAVPTFGFYEQDGTWGIEGHGVDPDIEVIDDPGLMLDGGDPQLETAVAVMLEAIANGEVPDRATRPASPDRSGMGIAEEDK